MNTSKIVKSLVAFASGAALAACVVQAQPTADKTTPAVAAKTAESQIATGDAIKIPNGNYSCTIDRYDPFPCRVVTDAEGRKRLEKLAGSQRFSGVIIASSNGFEFRGTFYCPSGECTEAVTGQFVAYDDGLYRGKLSTANNPTTVTIQYAEFGGSRYGAGRYGAGRYGGIGYGF